MKSLLILTDQYTVGGLETHINGEIRRLTAQGWKIHLAIGKQFDKDFIPDGVASITSGFDFGPAQSVAGLWQTICSLRELIRLNEIDVVHAHPFFAIFAGFIAAEFENTGFALTLHGPASLASYGPFHEFLLKQIILPHTPLVLAVSEEVAAMAAPYVPARALKIFRNSIDLSAFIDPTPDHEPLDRRWLVVSRLDEQKITGIFEFAVISKALGLPGIVIVGDGPAHAILQEKLNANQLGEFVEFLGTRLDVPSFAQRFEGVAGMGRVVLEGVALKKPVILIGYDGVKGLLQPSNFRSAMRANFSGRSLPNVNEDSFPKDVPLSQWGAQFTEALYSLAHKECDERLQWAKFEKWAHKLTAPSRTIFHGLFHDNTNSLSKIEEPFFESLTVIETLADLVNSQEYFNPALASSYELARQRMVDYKYKSEIEQQKTQIFLLQEELQREKEGAKEAMRVGKMFEISSQEALEALRHLEEKVRLLESNLKEKTELLKQYELYRADKENYIAALKVDIDTLQAEIVTLKSGWSGMFRNVRRRLQKIPFYGRRLYEIWDTSGFMGVLTVVRRRLRTTTSVHVHPQHWSSPTMPGLYAQTGIDTAPTIWSRTDELVIITGVPYDDIGGGQRAAQLARCALKAGRKVKYIYIFKKFDFELQSHVDSRVDIHGLEHLHIDATSPLEIMSGVSSNATLLVEFPHPRVVEYITLFNSRGLRTVFELIDDWETSLGTGWFDRDVYRNIVSMAQTVIGTAKILVKQLKKLGRQDAIYLPNAANEYIFDSYKKHDRPIDLPFNYKKIGLYFGSLYGDWFAWDYLEAAAKANPEYGFVLIGDRPSGVNMPDNVHMIGARNIDELPGYLQYSDFALLPFSPGKISDAVSPIKVFEYLFVGKPVVATRLPEIIGYPGVDIADSPTEFAALCTKVNDTKTDQALTEKFISENSWFTRLDKIINVEHRTRFKNRVSVVILIHNNKKIIGRCLESIQHHCKAYIKEIIVVDNASTDGGAEFVAEHFPKVKLLSNPENGCSSGRNLGARHASGDYLVFFDSDQWFTTSCSFEEALTILDMNAGIGAIGWGGGWFDAGRSDLGGMIADYSPNRGMNEIAIKKGYRSDIGYLGTCGFFMPKSVFDAIDGFDCAYDPTCFEDTDLSFQIKKLGLKICHRDLTGIRHQPHQTTGANSGSSAYRELFMRNAAYFKNKWKSNPDFYVDYVD
ncbi:glycosyltransferase [Ochrobactrum sp. GPK 3]|uniref:glycosyltransferase n=1 Tax=Brucella sp. 22210 TaxID=3453892 RepID=UPI0031385397